MHWFRKVIKGYPMLISLVENYNSCLIQENKSIVFPAINIPIFSSKINKFPHLILYCNGKMSQEHWHTGNLETFFVYCRVVCLYGQLQTSLFLGTKGRASQVHLTSLSCRKEEKKNNKVRSYIFSSPTWNIYPFPYSILLKQPAQICAYIW